jgi:hypothetical protein
MSGKKRKRGQADASVSVWAYWMNRVANAGCVREITKTKKNLRFVEPADPTGFDFS